MIERERGTERVRVEIVIPLADLKNPDFDAPAHAGRHAKRQAEDAVKAWRREHGVTE